MCIFLKKLSTHTHPHTKLNSKLMSKDWNTFVILPKRERLTKSAKHWKTMTCGTLWKKPHRPWFGVTIRETYSSKIHPTFYPSSPTSTSSLYPFQVSSLRMTAILIMWSAVYHVPFLPIYITPVFYIGCFDGEKSWSWENPYVWLQSPFLIIVSQS